MSTRQNEESGQTQQNSETDTASEQTEQQSSETEQKLPPKEGIEQRSL